MLKAMKEIIEIMKKMININTAMIDEQGKRIKSLEFMIDKYIVNNNALPYIPNEDDSELMINDPDDGSWKGR